MAIGDDATAAGMDVLAGTELANTLDTEINLTRDYIAQRTSAVQPVAKGGTGATSAVQARANLAAVGTEDVAIPDAAQPGKIPKYNAAGQLTTDNPSLGGHAASKAYVDAADAQLAARPIGVPASGGTFTGNVFFPNASPAVSGYTVAYLNTDGRLSRGASSEKFKERIEPIDPAALGDIWPEFSRFQMIGGDGSWKYGYIAERLAEHPDQQPFVVYDVFGEPLPASIDFIALLLAQNAQLHQQLDLLAQRLEALEARR